MTGQRHPGNYPLTIKPETLSHVADLCSWVPLPSCPPPGHPFPIKSLALSARVPPKTIHFWASPVQKLTKQKPRSLIHLLLFWDLSRHLQKLTNQEMEAWNIIWKYKRQPKMIKLKITRNKVKRSKANINLVSKWQKIKEMLKTESITWENENKPYLLFP